MPFEPPDYLSLLPPLDDAGPEAQSTSRSVGADDCDPPHVERGPEYSDLHTGSITADPIKSVLTEITRYRAAKMCGRGSRKFISAPELGAMKFPATEWLVSGLITDGSLVMISGEPKSTKTWAALEIALAVTTGTKAFGEYRTRGARQFAVFLQEDSYASAVKRLRALARTRAVDISSLDLHVECRGQLNLSEDADLAWIILETRRVHAAGLVLDPFRNIHVVEENSSTEMRAVMASLCLLRDLCGCAIIVVHHSAKAGKDSAARSPGQQMRGSGAVHGAVDGGIYLTSTDRESPTRWTNQVSVEVKGARCAGDFALTLDVEDDENGDAFSASWTVVSGDELAKAKSDRADRKAADSVSARAVETEALVLKAIEIIRASPMGIGSDALHERLAIRHGRLNGALELAEIDGRGIRKGPGYHGRWLPCDPVDKSPPSVGAF